MAIRKIITLENPILRRRTPRVRHFYPSFQKLVDDMFETLHKTSGVGLAAPQIGLSIRVFVAEYEEHKVAIFNPEIVEAKGEEIGQEGCLSIPGYVGVNIRRASKILVKGQDVRGKQLRIPAEGWFARILQHEIDHLNGLLYLDRLDRPEDLYKVIKESKGDGETKGMPAI